LGKDERLGESFRHPSADDASVVCSLGGQSSRWRGRNCMTNCLSNTLTGRRLSFASGVVALLAIALSSGCILGNDGRPLGVGSLNPLMTDGCAAEPSCGSACCSAGAGPSCADANGYSENRDGACHGGNCSLASYAWVPCRAVGHCLGGVFNFGLPPACISGPPPMPPGRFFPVPTRPAFCPRDDAARRM
jgi:hypothetical protein